MGLIKKFPPTSDGGNAKKRRKISPEQAFNQLVQQEDISISYTISLMC